MTSTRIEEFDRPSALTVNTVELTEQSLQWATQRFDNNSTDSPEEPETTQSTWQNFLQLLAIAGFRQWLTEGSLSLSSECLVSDRANGNLQVEGYQLRIIAMGGLGDEQVEIEIGVNAQPPHLCVLIEVYEEINQVTIVGGLQRSQLLAYLTEPRPNEQTNAQPYTVQLPAADFSIEPEQMLLTLSCLEPDATVTSVTRSAIGEITELVRRDRFSISTWLQNQIDSVAEQMHWMLFPPTATAMRAAKEPIDIALAALLTQGVQLPTQASGVGGPIAVGSCVCQLYAWAWIEEPEPASDGLEWSLFLLLGPSAGQTLPAGIQLQVRDNAEILATEVLAESSREAYLYTQVQGTQQEEFRATVILPDGLEMTLPPFSFEG